MSLAGFDQLYEHADSLQQPVSLVAVGGADSTVIQALRQAADRGWIQPALTGEEAQIRELAQRVGVGLDGFRFIDTHDPADAAVREVIKGTAQLLMKGQVTTPELMRAVLDPSTGLRTERSISQVVLMELIDAQRRFLLADTGICIQPSLDQKIGIVRSVTEVAQRLGAAEPRVALMAATESVTDKMPETLDAAAIQGRAEAGELGRCVVRGPLSFDLAFSGDAAQKKSAQDPVSGRADAMVFPNLLSANLTVKAIMYTANCRFGGVLWGARCPVVFMSRADTAETRLNSIALAVCLLTDISTAMTDAIAGYSVTVP